MAKEAKGNLSTDKGVFIPVADRAPHRPELAKMNKADATAAVAKQKEDAKKIKKYAKELAAKEPEAPKEEVKTESKVAEMAKKKSKK